MKNIILKSQGRSWNTFHPVQFTPAQVLVLGFALVILVGALLLTLPQATVDGRGISFLNALFTATSAVCVTGLVVVDTGTTFTTFGQVVIMLLIQAGGLGFMTVGTLFALIIGKRVTLKERLMLQEALNLESIQGVVRLAKYVLQVTFILEAAGALILSLRWSWDFGWQKGIYFGIFHAVSAFNNAGFDLFGDFSSLTGYVGDPVVNLTIMALIILGGLGCTVLSDVYLHKGKHLSLHTRLVLAMTAVLIVGGTVVIFLLEYSNARTLGNLPLDTKAWAALFQSVTPRTAGFNTINLADMRMTTLLFLVVLMFIGASPGGTGGGIKTTTFVSIVLSVINTFRGETHVGVWGRTLPRETIKKAIAITFMAIVLVFFATSVLSLTEHADLMTILFEVTSAFGTVGLSLGLTTQLTLAGKIAIILTMFVGRVGPLTLAVALSRKANQSRAQIKYPEERVIIG